MTGIAGSLRLYGGLSMRFATPADQDFLLDLFIEARPWLGLADGGRDFIRFLYEDQMRITRLGAEARYPQHLDFVVEKTGQSVGRLIVDLGYTDWRIAELQIRAAARGKGIGSDLIRSLQTSAESGRMPLTLSTPTSMGIAPLYQRLGFRVMEVVEPMCHMAWFPPGHPQAATTAA